MREGRVFEKNRGTEWHKIQARRYKRNASADKEGGPMAYPESSAHAEGCSQGHTRQTEGAIFEFSFS